MTEISFVPLDEKLHLQMLFEWRNEPHVAERWDGGTSLDEVRDDYFGEDDEPGLQRYIAIFDGEPAAYIQVYWTMYADSGWWENEKSPATVGIDFFIGRAEFLNRGNGSKMIGEFVQMLFKDKSIERIISDSAPENVRSIKCLEKVGFKKVDNIVTPDGPAVLMERLRGEESL